MRGEGKEEALCWVGPGEDARTHRRDTGGLQTPEANRVANTLQRLRSDGWLQNTKKIDERISRRALEICVCMDVS